MKCRILLIISLWVSLTALAQNKGDIELGGNVGVNISNVAINSDNDFNTESKSGFNLTASGEYYFSDRWGIKAKLIYDQKGWGDSFVLRLDGSVVEEDMELDYLTIPVMANLHFGRKRNWYLNLGLYTGFLVNAELDGEDTKDFFNNVDIGLALGIGVKFPISDKAKLFIEYDGQSGFIDIVEKSENNGSSLELRNGRSAFNIGVLFTL